MMESEIELQVLKDGWKDEEWYHQRINERFAEFVNGTPELKEHRDFVQNHVWGFGERSFWWMWKLLCDELPQNFSFLEVGVFKGATLSVIKLLRPDANVFGITPLDSTGIDWEDDYRQRIHDIFDKFNDSKYPHIFHGRSDNDKVVAAATMLKYDVVYIDGDHSYEGALFDLNTYAPQVKSGGYLVIDDAACRTSQPWGYFQGIQSVSDALETWEQIPMEMPFEFQFNVVHLMVYKRK